MDVAAPVDHDQLARDLAESLERYRAILDTAVDAIITISENGAIETFNRAAETIFGYAPDEIVGVNIHRLMPEPHRSRHDDYLKRYLEGGEARVIGFGREVHGLRKDGTEFPMELSIGEVQLPNRRLFTGIARDISDRKAMEAECRQRLAELAHAGRVATVGEMVTALAHEINQPLTAIIAHSGACLRLLDGQTPDTGLLGESLQQIARQGERAGEVIKRLRHFVRKTRQRWEQGDLNAIVRNVLPLISPELQAAGVHLRLQLAPELPKAAMDVVQIEQVVFNLVQNAIEALQQLPPAAPRELLLQSARVHLGAWPAVELRAIDSGPGFGELDPERLFQPYYTTHQDAMGQGLAICRTILQHHDGEIVAEPATEGGACFRLRLPLKPVAGTPCPAGLGLA